MSQFSQLMTHEEPARCSVDDEQSSSLNLPKTERFDDHEFRAPATPARSTCFNLKPPIKFPRLSTPSFSSDLRHYNSSNICQENFGPSTSHSSNFRNFDQPIASSDQVFEIFLDVHEYKADELKVKLVDNFIIIDGEHGERTDDISLISQQFTRRYHVPEELDKGKISCFISTDGVLCIFGPKTLNKADREIPIISVDRPTKMTASTKFKTLEKKFLRSVKNQALMKRSQAQVKTLTFEESILPLSGVVPVTEEQEPAEHPETKEQENVPE